MDAVAKCFSELIAAVVAVLMIVLYAIFYAFLFVLFIALMIVIIPFGLLVAIVAILMDCFSENSKH